MADVSVKIEGLEQLQRALKELPRKLAGQVLGQATKAGAELVVAAARQRAPKKSHLVEKNISVQKGRGSLPERALYEVGVKKTRTKRGKRNWSPFYWRFLEFGTKKMRARPFMVPAWEATQREALETITNNLKQGLEKVAREVAW